MGFHYILDGKKAVECNDIRKWAEWMEEADRRVAYDEINDVQVSTFFLGVFVNTFTDNRPVLFETMVFGDEDCELNNYSRKYATWNEAEAGHKEVVDMVKETMLEQVLIKGL